MEKQSRRWEEEQDEDIITTILRNDFHAITFEYDNEEYVFSGWWVLDIGEDDDNYKEYDSKEEFLDDPIFNGKTLKEIVNDVEIIIVELEPW